MTEEVNSCKRYTNDTIEWEEYEVNSYESANKVLYAIGRYYPHAVTAGAFDTETTGLNPVRDRPFLYQCGLYSEKLQKGLTVVMDLEYTPKDVVKYFITIWHQFMERTPVYLGHHIVFDLHMMTNIGLPYTADNVSDTQFYIRASSDAIQQDKGGEPLDLKGWAVKHIDKHANDSEKELKAERTAQAKAYNAQLIKMTGLKKKQFDEFFKDKTNDYTDLPQEIRGKYLRWHDNLPAYLRDVVTGTVNSDQIRYSEIDREKVKKYGHGDVRLTLITYRLCEPVVKVRDNFELIRRENMEIYPLLRMERVGFVVNRTYVSNAKVETKKYIRQRRHDLELLCGEKLAVGQHERIKQILWEQYGLQVDSTGKEQLEQTASDLKRAHENEEAVEFIETILELRTLEKWYATYICRFDNELKHGDRIYTAIHQVGAVSGRVTCDFQQFPKAGLQTIEGKELFSPRAMVIVTDEYPALVYLDYSQIELRLQALYTYLIGEPDLNLCRAYSPYKCHRADGHEYDPEHDVKQAYIGEWYRDEDNQLWVPTDVHGATTEHAFGITPDDPRFHDLRYVGKRVNFAKNYGASLKRIKEMFPEYDDATCKNIDEAYYKAFPGVKKYHEACFHWAEYPWMDNLFGVKYYGVSGHNLRNMLVQGTGAYYLKEKIVQVDKYLIEHHCKSKWCMQIHDELQFYWHKDDDPKIFFDIKAIMEDSTAQMPIIADMEVTTTTWKNKQEVSNLDELYQILHWS